nr:hypothetical protein GCM10020241_55800 [Streptoalloteichus tenebrarius]
MQGDQVGARVDPQLVGQPVPQVAVAVQRLALPARPVQGHELRRAQALAQRVLRDQVGQLADQYAVVAQREPRLGLLLQRDQPQLLQPPDHRGEQRAVGEVGERRAPPQRERLGQQVGPRPRVLARPRLGRQGREPLRVHGLGVDAQQVAGRS